MITPKYTAKDLREKYFQFFESKGHTRILSASLVPENDPTVLFTTAGMHPLVPYLLGEKHPGGKRVVSAQKCVRTDDIEEVGDMIHHTFFEMLGNWSFGDYFKEEAIKWSWEFLTDSQWLGIDKNRLAISIFAGDQDAPLDEESKAIWLKLGIPAERIAALPKKDNWWGPAGQTGPCGPDTEMFYWSSTEPAPAKFDGQDDRWVEIWNDVFMQYNKKSDGTFEPLKQQNVDTGMGLERTLAVLNGIDDNYRTELFWPIIQKIEELSGKTYSEYAKEMRIIADHVRASVFMIADGVVPSNTDQGYVLRRLLRRAILRQKQLKLNVKNLSEFIPDIGAIYKDIYPNLTQNQEYLRIKKVMGDEGGKFLTVIHNGDKRLFDLVNKKLFKEQKEPITGTDLFEVFSVHGYPLELSLEEIDVLICDKNIQKEFYDKEAITIGFQEEMKKHQELSRTAAAGKFAGGLADHGEAAVKYHTATHLLHAALRQVLGKQVEQKGSNITAERLRFDFSHPQKMTDKELSQVEDLVNAAIQRDYQVSFQEMTVAEAKEAKAIGLFEAKYGDKVKVYTVGDIYEEPLADPLSPTFSREICGGPHVEHTAVLGKFKIQKEEAVSSGVRRIKAVLE